MGNAKADDRSGGAEKGYHTSAFPSDLDRHLDRSRNRGIGRHRSGARPRPTL